MVVRRLFDNLYACCKMVVNTVVQGFPRLFLLCAHHTTTILMDHGRESCLQFLPLHPIYMVLNPMPLLDERPI